MLAPCKAGVDTPLLGPLHIRGPSAPTLNEGVGGRTLLLTPGFLLKLAANVDFGR